MYLDNPIIVLLGIFSQKNKDNIISFKQLQDLLPLEKSQISQALSYNSKIGLIQKAEGNKYFTKIQITPEGIQKAKRCITFLEKLITISPSPSPRRPKSTPKSPTPPPQLNSFVDKLFSPLKKTLKNSLQDYIPESHLTLDMLNDITDDILTFFHNKLEKSDNFP
jgi:hypothetical protein